MARKEAERAAKKMGRAEERAETEKTMAKLRDEERAEYMRTRQKKDRYASELIGQMDFNGRLRYMEEAEKIRERMAGEEARKEYVTKMETALAGAQGITNASIYSDHPFQTLIKQNRLPTSMTQVLS